MDFFSPSLLDKLLGADADGQQRATSPRWSIEQIKESVARDIETLLNARPGIAPEDLQAFPQLTRSLLTYGLIDITSLNVASDRDRLRITESIRRSLAAHEPRLTQVEVQVRETAKVGAGLCFSIRAKLQLSPTAEPVAFDAMLQPGSNRYAVARSDPRAAH
ncbi:type VI secretion system baseplate subunit TssE [Ideonella azotifigens]|uniref:Type VI secretion system baseplate subunit TssE n=1 Tax=Ideonella azotifigens TaxID=513160 RepID=A0ABN1KI37_9BURK|nr:type VI secretion system baseplate subunit TssE [Ideonella azotifigens]MCD2339619.1 type VI secretion system baseplate subunit TssE [Ideonella azotifigens]